MKSLLKTNIPFAALAALLMIATPCSVIQAGEKFDSFNGHFAITIPDDWTRMDYRTVDYYLSRSADTVTDFQYEAVFAPRSDRPFYEGPYLLLTVDTVGRFSREEIDSTASDIAASFNMPLVKRSITALAADVPLDTAVYDRDQKIVAVLSNYWEAGAVVKKSLLMIKFYDRGFASFYFYSPPASFAAVSPTFQSIISSFTTENISGGSTAPVDVARINKQSKQRVPIWLIVAIIVIAVIVVIFVRRQRQSTART